MLSNYPRLHRRQNSTPTAFAGVKKPSAVSAAAPSSRSSHHASAAGHRRGLSLDTRGQKMVLGAVAATSPTTRQQGHMVSSTTTTATNNTGLGHAPQHHVLREAQSQSTQARPGTQDRRTCGQSSQQQSQRHLSHQRMTSQDHFSPQALSDLENYLTPHGTPQTQPYDPACFDPTQASFNTFLSQANLAAVQYTNAMAGNQDFELFATQSAQSTPTFPNFQDSPGSQGWNSEGESPGGKRTVRRVSNGIKDRVSKYEGMGFNDMQRPTTPPHQNGNHYFPPTPMETPHEARKQQQQPNQDNFSEVFDEWMEETIKPIRSRSQPGTQSNFAEMRRQLEQQENGGPSPPSSSTMPVTKSFSSMSHTAPFVHNNLVMNSFEDDFNSMIRMPNEQGMFNVGGMSANMAGNSAQMDQFFQPGGQGTPTPVHSATPSRHSSPHRSHRRTESLVSAASESVASIADINIDESKTETGITSDDINEHISGPDETGKWTCVFPECNKRFGRKENIKSHVQTHLNDRQYVCPKCNKRFVRQHDLKRHAKIHTGLKPYPCQCGNSFARHDALTRHRQRGMCIGAFDGVVRKVVKRGRPRKHRPELDERQEKARRTRKKNMSVSSVSSVSGYSDSSAAGSPIDNDFQMLEDALDMEMEGSAMPMSQNMVSSAPMPSFGSQHSISPEAHSPLSYVSPEALMGATSPASHISHVSYAPSPAKSAVSHRSPRHSYELPELSQSCSPPANQLFDNEPASSAASSVDLAALTATSGIDQDDDLLLHLANSGDLGSLERDTSMLAMSKFDEEFNVGMFSNSDDIFFD